MKKKNILEQEYRKAFDYLWKMREFVWIVILLFFIFIFLGFFVPVSDTFSNYIFEYLKELLAQTEGFSYSQWFSFIFLNNISSSFTSSFLGVLFGIFPILSTFVNGFLLGFVSKLSIIEGGIFSLWRLFPHGIFELPAIFISLATGLKLGTFVFQKKKRDSLKIYFENNIRIFILIVMPLLFIAALIESAFIFFG